MPTSALPFAPAPVTVTPRQVDRGGLPPQDLPALTATKKGTGWLNARPVTSAPPENPHAWAEPDYTTGARPARMPLVIKTAIRAFHAVANDDFFVRQRAPARQVSQGFGHASEVWRQRANIANRRAPAFGSTFIMDERGYGFGSDVFALTPGVPS